MAVKMTVAEAVRASIQYEVEQKERDKNIAQYIDAMEAKASEISDADIEEFKRFGIDLNGLYSVDFDAIRNDKQIQRDYIELAKGIQEKLIVFVQEHAEL